MKVDLEELKGEMAKKYAVLFLVVLLVFVVVSFSVGDTDSSLVFAHNQKDCVVDKAAGDYFTVQVTFQSIGKTEGTLSINIAFGDKVWS
jgi:hypothetical protein